jgi:hypothetical protein
MSSLNLNFTWRASITDAGKKGLAKEAKETLGEFFQNFSHNLGKVSLTVLRVGRGCDREKLIKICPKHELGGRSFPGVSVSIFTSGTQGLFCAMTAELMSDRELEKIVNDGPYRKKRTLIKAMASVEASESVAPSMPAHTPEHGREQVPTVSEATPEPVLHVAKAKPEQAEASKHFGGSKGIEEVKTNEALVASGLPQHDLDLLRVFMSELVEPYTLPYFIEQKAIPPFVEIPCSVISAKMKKDWVIKKPQGGYAQLYATRISHFGYKSNNVPEGERSGTWLLHVPTVVNFVGGLHKLPRKHKGEGDGKSGNGVVGEKFNLIEHVAPISGPYMLGSLSDALDEQAILEENALIERLHEMILKRQRLEGLIGDEDTLIEKAEAEIRSADEAIAELERKKATIQISLLERRIRVDNLNRQLNELQIPKIDEDSLRKRFAALNALAKMAGIKLGE